MIGIPGETKEQMFETIELAKTINCNSLMFSVVVPQPHIALEKTCKEKGWILPHQLSDLEKPGIHPYSLFKTDEWLGRSSLFRTDEWDPEFIETVKQKIVQDFDKMGWERRGFTFTNIPKEVNDYFVRYVGLQVFGFLKSFDLERVNWIFRAIKYKTQKIR